MLIGDDVGLMSTIKVWLPSQSSMMNSGAISYILGINLLQDGWNGRIGLSHSTHIDKILLEYNMTI